MELISGFEGRSNLNGFVRDPQKLAHGVGKQLECKFRIRLAASRLYLERGRFPSLSEVANEAGGVSTRTIRTYFPTNSEILAFPPPEMAAAIVESTNGVNDLDQIPTAIRPLLDALQDNSEGRVLLGNLSRIHDCSFELSGSDNYFAAEMHRRLVERDGPATSRRNALVGFFSEAFRSALREWSSDLTASTANLEGHLRSLLAERPLRSAAWIRAESAIEKVD
jgi:AcrR family transcriptional regulator